MSSIDLIATATAVLCGCFIGLFVLARRMNNYGIVDIAWSYAFAAIAVLYAALGHGWQPRRALLAGLAAIWSGRLGTHLFRRVMRHHPHEDRRYQQLRKDWASHFIWKMAGFFQLQAVSVVWISVPFLIICQNSRPGFEPLEFAGAALWLVAIVGEYISDAQLARFAREQAGTAGVCDRGLWRYSRHPNYFFEWLNWVSYFILALAAPSGAWALIGPASILWLLLRVTGIPMTEQQSLRSRGDAYRRYQQTTSAFVPWFPRKPAI